jgi:two-component system, NtrC family, response regulator PilR
LLSCAGDFLFLSRRSQKAIVPWTRWHFDLLGGDSMKGKVFALMVHERPEPCQALKLVLKRLGVDTFSVSSCEEAEHLLEQTHPHLLFADIKLPDGTWIDVLNLAGDAPAPICTILVSPSKDSELSQAARDYGAFGCVSPAFNIETVSELIQRAILFVQAGRDRDARSAVA